jgi:branched-chain amino acid transport system ATP-binding protein
MTVVTTERQVALEVEDVHTYYGNSHILRGVSLEIPRGRVVGVLGRNGAGKSTLVKSIVGFIPVRSGSIRIQGAEVATLPSYRVMRHGAALVPQGRRVFKSLTVVENLTVGARRDGDDANAWTLDRVWELFPQLRARRRNRGNELSGGEQSMLSIARALMRNPSLLVTDEPSEGLSPQRTELVGDVLNQIKEEGFSILLAEQNLSLALAASDEVYILSRGEIAWHGTPDALKEEPVVLRQYLGLGV